MTLRFIADLPSVPWRNGGGMTREIARSDGPAGIIWRLSVAQVAQPGAFSAFPGVRRCLTVFRGKDLELAFDDGTHLTGADPFWFSGDKPVLCAIPSGPVTVVNFMHDPLAAGAEVSVIAGPVRDRLVASAGTVFCLFGLSGSLVVDDTAGDAGSYAIIEGGARRFALDSGSRALQIRLTLLRC
jgi:environmental stress-induced protein Ves